MSAAIAQDIWKAIDTFHDNATLSVIARLSKSCNKRTKKLLSKRKQQKKEQETRVYRQMVFMSLKWGTDMSLEGNPLAILARVRINADGQYNLFVTTVNERPEGAYRKEVPVRVPDTSDAFEDELQRACDLHAVYLYERLGPL